MTPRQKEVLDFISAEIARTGCAPTYAEMQAGLGLKSRAATAFVVGQLERQGLLIRDPGRTRGITLVTKMAEGVSVQSLLAGVPSKALVDELQRRARKNG